jgi:hypothetical protein
MGLAWLSNMSYPAVILSNDTEMIDEWDIKWDYGSEKEFTVHIGFLLCGATLAGMVIDGVRVTRYLPM